LNRAEILSSTEYVLEKAGYQLSKRCQTNCSCFDLAAKDENKLLFLKVHSDIDKTCLNEVAELQKVSGCFSAVPLFVAQSSRRKPLEDDTVYNRYDVCTITAKTFADILLRGAYPLVEAGPGGYYIALDGQSIRKRRREMGLSVGKLAELAGLSVRTLYNYERGLAKASVPVAYRLEWLLGVPVIQSTDVFHGPEQMCLLTSARQLFAKRRLLKEVFRKFAEFDLCVTSTGRAPFDFIVRCPNEGVRIVGGLVGANEPDLDKRVNEIKNLGALVGAQPVFISYDENIPTKRTQVLTQKEFKKIKSPKELLTLS
jgi:putative transcriptional regulator